MATLGSADFMLVPKFDGLKDAVRKQMKEIEGEYESSGTKSGSGFGKGLAASGASFGIFSNLASRAIDSVSAHVGDAVSRFDTLNNYPKVMESLGYAAEDADRSITTMSDRLSTLPTRLDDMASTVQGLAVITGDLDKATDAGLALNDMLLASGSSTQLTTAAMEQFRQMLSKGKPEMEDWKSLTAAMPGQLDQLAKSLLGPTANANDLYAALGGGGKEATITMDQLLDEIIRLDKEGGDGFASFQEQAETAAGGIATSMSNTANAVTKGITGILDVIGKENIAGAFGGIKSAIDSTFGAVQSALRKAMPTVNGMVKSFAPLAPAVTKTVVAFAAFRGVGGVILDVGKRVKDLKDATGLLAGANTLLGTSFTPLTAGLTAAAGAAALVAGAVMDARKHSEDLDTVTRGLHDVVADTTALDDYRGTLDDVAASADTASPSISQLAESTSRHVAAMQENNQKAETQIATLNSVKQIIDECAGKTDLNAEASGRLNWALGVLNDQLGVNIDANDVMNGQYEDADGKVRNLSESIGELIEQKKNEARVAALTDNLTEAYDNQNEKTKALADARRDYNKQVEWWMEKCPELTREEVERTKVGEKWKNNLEVATKAADDANASVSALEEELGLQATATDESATALERWGASTSGDFRAQLESCGTSITGFVEDLEGMGVSAEQMSTLTNDQLISLALAYDGTMGSIALLLDEYGVKVDESVIKSAQAAEGIKTGLSQMEGATEGLRAAGVDVDAFSLALAGAGVSTADLNAIGSANLTALAAACEGNIGMMLFFIQNYNDTPIVDKDGKVNIDDAKLVDAQGNVYTWNGSTIVDKSGNALVNDTELMDAQGNVYTWNKSGDLVDKDGNAIIKGNVAESNIEVDKFKNQPSNLGEKTGKVSIFKTITESVKKMFGKGKAAGGIRTHADGGIVPRYHARGAIATQAVPLDIVGEAGAEAIVPLTNKRYSQPFVDLIAEGVAGKMRGDGTNVYIDGAAINASPALSQAMGMLFDALNREYDMGVC